MTTLIIGGGQLAYYLSKKIMGSIIASIDLPDWYEGEFWRIDIADENSVNSTLDSIRPNLIINTAGISSIPESFKDLGRCFRINLMGTIYVLDWVAKHPTTKFVQCSSVEAYCPRKIQTGEVFGVDKLNFNKEVIKDEQCLLKSNNPYGKSKAYSQDIVDLYRDTLNLDVSCAVFANFESKLRDDKFVTGKIIKFINECKKYGCVNASSYAYNDDAATYFHWGQHTMTTAAPFRVEKLVLGNIDSWRSWMHASEAAEGIVRIASYKKPGSWVFAGSNYSSVRYFCERSFELAGLKEIEPVMWTTSNHLKRDYEPSWVMASSKKARQELGWATTFTLDDIIKDMLSV